MKSNANPSILHDEQRLQQTTVRPETLEKLREEVQCCPHDLTYLRNAIDILSPEDCPCLELDTFWKQLESLESTRATLFREAGQKFIQLSIDDEARIGEYQKLEFWALSAETKILQGKRELMKQMLRIVSAPDTGAVIGAQAGPSER